MSSFSCFKNKNEIENTIDVVKQVVTSLESQINTLKKKADDTTGKIMSVEHVGGVFRRRNTNISSYTSRSNSYYENNSVKYCAENALAWADKTYKEAKEKHELNVPAIENNIKVIEKVKLFMDNVGIPSYYSTTDPKSRARYPKSIKESSGYIEDINRYIKTDDGWNLADKDYTHMLTDINNYLETALKEEEAKKKIVEADQKKKESELQRAALVVKYGLDYTANWYSILDKILNKNKYLRLTYYLCKNRGDWSDGYDYAETGIDGFIIENETDQLIYNDIHECIADWDGDGRIFRDCEWNYDRIFGLVDDVDLKKDYEIANANNE